MQIMMRSLQLLLVCSTLLWIAVFSGQNSNPIVLNFLGFQSVSLPLGLVLLSAIVAGIWSAVIMVALATRHRKPIQEALQALSSAARG